MGSAAGARLREGDDVADGIFASQQHDQAVETNSDAAMRGRAKLERMNQVAKLHFHIFIVDAAALQNALLQLGVVNTNGAATSLEAVHDDVVAVAAACHGVGLRILSQSDFGIIVNG